MLKEKNIDISFIKLGQSNIEKIYLGQNVIWVKMNYEIMNYKVN